MERVGWKIVGESYYSTPREWRQHLWRTRERVDVLSASFYQNSLDVGGKKTFREPCWFSTHERKNLSSFTLKNHPPDCYTFRQRWRTCSHTHTQMHTHADSNVKAGQENGVKSSFKGSDGGVSELGQHVHGACVSLQVMKGRHRKHLLIFTWATLRSAGPKAAELLDPPKIVTNQTTHPE